MAVSKKTVYSKKAGQLLLSIWINKTKWMIRQTVLCLIFSVASDSYLISKISS